MSTFFRPYEGAKPYLFISYAHRDTDRVLPVIAPLHRDLYRLWYDEGIPAGIDWPKNIAQHMEGCRGVLFFLSAASLASKNCLMEMQKAKALGKPVLCVGLEDVALPDAWQAALAEAQALPAKAAGEALAKGILSSGFVTEDFLGDGASDGEGRGGKGGFNGWIAAIVLGVLLWIAAGLGVYGLQSGWFAALLPQATPAPTARPTATPAPTPAPTIDVGAWADAIGGTVAFDDSTTERAVRNALQQPEGDVPSAWLYRVTALHLCGSSVLKSGKGIAYDENGVCCANGARVARGSVEKLAVYGDMKALTELTLAYQHIVSVAALGKLTLLTSLNLSGNDALTSVAGLTDNLSLQTLNLSHTGVADVTPLNALPSLKTVYVSPEMFPLLVNEATQRYDLALAP